MATTSTSYQSTGTCYICHTLIPLGQLAEHEKQCLLDLQDGEAEYGVSGPLSDTASDDSRNSVDAGVKSLRRCYICGTTLKPHQIGSHERTCLRKWQTEPNQSGKVSADSMWTGLVARGELRKAKSMSSLLTNSSLKSPSSKTNENGFATKSPFADATPKKNATRPSSRTSNSNQATPNGRMNNNNNSKMPVKKKSPIQSNGLERQMKAKSYGDLHRLIKSPANKSPISRITPLHSRVKSKNNINDTASPTAASRTSRLIRCCVCEREFSIHSIGIHEVRCAKIRDDREKRELAEKEKERKEKERRRTPKRQPNKDGGDTPSRGAGLLRCYICGNLFGTRSLGIHEPQCLKKFHAENDQLPKNKRRQLPQKPSIPSMLLLDSGKEIPYANDEKNPTSPNESRNGVIPCKELSFDDTDNHDNTLLRCDYCDHKFQRSSMASHVPLCREKYKPRNKNKDSETNGGSLFSFGLNDKGSKGALKACQYCGKECLSTDMDRHENRCSEK